MMSLGRALCPGSESLHPETHREKIQEKKLRLSFPDFLSSETVEDMTNFPFSVHSLNRESLSVSPSTSHVARDSRTTLAPASIVLLKAEDKNDTVRRPES